MSRITADVVTSLAYVWHRFEPVGQDMDALAQMLAPMDDAGESLSERVRFDMEPADYLSGLQAMASPRETSGEKP